MSTEHFTNQSQNLSVKEDGALDSLSTQQYTHTSITTSLLSETYGLILQ